jgi:hypothetical protein
MAAVRFDGAKTRFGRAEARRGRAEVRFDGAKRLRPWPQSDLMPHKRAPAAQKRAAVAQNCASTARNDCGHGLSQI